MPHTILRSVLAQRGWTLTGFNNAVDSHILELETHASHQTLVTAGKAEPYPPPDPHPDVDKAVRRVESADGATKFVSDYDVVDDSAVEQERALRARKTALLTEVSQHEQVAIVAVLPPGKHRLFNMRRADIMQTRDLEGVVAAIKSSLAKHQERLGQITTSADADPAQQELVSKSLEDVKNLISVDQGLLQAAEEQLAVIYKERGVNDPEKQTLEDTEFLDDLSEKTRRIRLIERYGAELHAAIEDLTMDTVDTWVYAAFPV